MCQVDIRIFEVIDVANQAAHLRLKSGDFLMVLVHEVLQLLSIILTLAFVVLLALVTASVIRVSLLNIRPFEEHTCGLALGVRNNRQNRLQVSSFLDS